MCIRDRVSNVNMVKIATDIITLDLTGRETPVTALEEKKIPHVGVKQAVFPFNMFPEVDPILGPEMRSTGEVLGLGASYGAASVSYTHLDVYKRQIIMCSDSYIFIMEVGCKRMSTFFH